MLRACRSRLSIRASHLSALRESPTPIVFAHGLWHCSSASWSLARSPLLDALHRGGFTTGLLDLPGYGGAQALPRTWTLDDLIDDVRLALAALKAPCVVVAPSFSAHLMLKYLESHALAGLAMVAPFETLDAGVFVRDLLLLSGDGDGRRRHAAPPFQTGSSRNAAEGSKLSAPGLQPHGNGGSPLVSRTPFLSPLPESAAILSVLRSIGSDPDVAKAAFCRHPDGTDHADEEDWLAAWQESASAACMSDPSQEAAATVLCGVEAGAAMLRLLAAEPALVEPQPVPMAAYVGARATALAPAPVAAESQLILHHSIEEDSLWVDPSAGPEELLFNEQAASKLAPAILTWISDRY